MGDQKIGTFIVAFGIIRPKSGKIIKFWSKYAQKVKLENFLQNFLSPFLARFLELNYVKSPNRVYIVSESIESQNLASKMVGPLYLHLF